MSGPEGSAPVSCDDAGMAGQAEGANASRLTSEQLRTRLSSDQLTVNQRKKLRKKLSKLFNGDGEPGEYGMASSEFSGMVDEWDASPSTQQPSGGAVAMPMHGDYMPHGDAPSVGRPPKRARKQQQQAPASALSGGLSCTDFHALAGEPGESASVRHSAVGGAAGPHRGATPEASVCHTNAPAAPAQPATGPGIGGGPAAAQPCLLPRHGMVPVPVHAHGRRMGGGPAVDLSSVMHLIAAELRAAEAAAGGAPCTPGGGLLEGAAAASAQQPSTSGRRNFCRVNLSQSMSVISAELSASEVAAAAANDTGTAAVFARKRGRDEAVEGEEGGAPAAGTSGGGGEAAQQAGGVPSGGGQPGKQQGSKKQKKTFAHGNYHNYYGYRALGSFDDDPRLRLFRAEWFKGKDVLDIGCNEGLITLAVAAGFGASRTTGVDIDDALVRRCGANLRDVRARLTERLRPNGRGSSGGGGAGGAGGGGGKSHAVALADAVIATATAALAEAKAQALSDSQGVAASQQRMESGDAAGTSGIAGLPQQDGAADGADDGGAEPPSGSGFDGGATSAGGSGADGSTGGGGGSSHSSALRSALKSLSRTSFKRQDWAKVRTRHARYDTILCLSVTKWVHLNGGDAALRKLFRKMRDTLSPGGLLVLEPQQWRSYQSAVRKPQTAKDADGRPRDLDALTLRPDGFLAHLHDTLGFELVADLNASSSSFHFDRPMYILRRPDEAEGGGAGGQAGGSA